MLSWLLAILAGAAVALVSYGSAVRSNSPWLWIAAFLRAAAIALLTAAVLDAPLGLQRRLAPVVLLDASASWLRSGDTAAWRAAQDTARRLSRDSVVLFGATPRLAAVPSAPDDQASHLQPALVQALGSGRSVVVITDGEIDDGSTALNALPGGSRIVVPERGRFRDVAVVSADAPRFVSTGDSIGVRVSIGSGSGGAGSGTLTMYLGGRLVASTAVDSMPALSERVELLRGFWDGREDGPSVLQLVARFDGDSEVRNDTLNSAVDLSTTPGVVFVSTSPDLDSRYALAVLHGTLALPTRAFLRVASGNWRLEGPLTQVDESEVRRSVSNAPVVIIHGDTAMLGSPRELTRGSLALISTVTDGGDWYPVGTPSSPLAAALSGIPWDSLPPVEASARLPRGDWEGLEVRRGRQAERRMLVSGTDSPRRIAVVGAAGLWRWAFKGGPSADAFEAFWGSVFDWLVAESADARAATPAASYVRAGEIVRWRKGTGADSMVDVLVTPRGSTAQGDTIHLRFGPTGAAAESPALAPGLYDVSSEGGRSLLAVNASFEMIPRRPAVVTADIEGVAPAGERRGSRRTSGVFVTLVLILCTEWFLRRRLGLR